MIELESVVSGKECRGHRAQNLDALRERAGNRRHYPENERGACRLRDRLRKHYAKVDRSHKADPRCRKHGVHPPVSPSVLAGPISSPSDPADRRRLFCPQARRAPGPESPQAPRLPA